MEQTSENIKKVFGMNLRVIRKGRKWTQETISELIGIEPSAYGRIERGESFPHIRNLAKILNVIEVELPPLFEDHNTKNNE